MQFLCDLSVGDSGEEVLYGTTDGQIGVVQLSRFHYVVMPTVNCVYVTENAFVTFLIYSISLSMQFVLQTLAYLASNIQITADTRRPQSVSERMYMCHSTHIQQLQ